MSGSNITYSQECKEFLENCRSGDLNAVSRMMAQQWLDLNCQQELSLFTPLHMACGNGRVEVVKVLLSHPKVNPNSLSKQLLTPLMIACKSPIEGAFEVVEVLLKNSAVDVNHVATENGQTVTAMDIALKNNLRLVRLLWSSGRVGQPQQQRSQNGPGAPAPSSPPASTGNPSQPSAPLSSPVTPHTETTREVPTLASSSAAASSSTARTKETHPAIAPITPRRPGERGPSDLPREATSPPAPVSASPKQQEREDQPDILMLDPDTKQWEDPEIKQRKPQRRIQEEVPVEADPSAASTSKTPTPVEPPVTPVKPATPATKYEDGAPVTPTTKAEDGAPPCKKLDKVRKVLVIQGRCSPRECELPTNTLHDLEDAVSRDFNIKGKFELVYRHKGYRRNIQLQERDLDNIPVLIIHDLPNAEEAKRMRKKQKIIEEPQKVSDGAEMNQ